MAKKRPNMSDYEDFEEVETSSGGENYGYGYPNFNFGMPAGFDLPGMAYASTDNADDEDFSNTKRNAFDDDDADDVSKSTTVVKEKKKKKKRKKSKRRRESNFFFVNRKFPCFIMFVCFLLCFAIIGLSVLGAMPSMKKNGIVSMLLEFTALYKKPDMTPEEERTPTTDEEGNEVAYKDKSEYIGFFDILLGTIKGVFGIGGTEEVPAADKNAATEDGATAEGEEDGGFSMDTPFTDSVKAEVKTKGFTSGLPLTLADYFGFALLLFAIVALYFMIKAFAALFGKRVFKHFGFASILMLVSAVVVLVGSVSILSIFVSPAGETAELQFGAMMDFLTGGFSQPPKFTFVMGEGSEDIINLPFVAGYGFYIMLVLPIVTLLFSMAARKKLPYSIFD